MRYFDLDIDLNLRHTKESLKEYTRSGRIANNDIGPDRENDGDEEGASTVFTTSELQKWSLKHHVTAMTLLDNTKWADLTHN